MATRPLSCSWILLLVCLSVCPLMATACGRGSIYITNNEYKQMLIAIDSNVTESAALLERIQQTFTDASRLLYQVTKQRAYWDEITILIPTTWSDSDQYEAVVDETQDTSDVEIRTPDVTQADPNLPFTIPGQSCGYLGMYISLTDQFLLDDTIAAAYGPYEKVLVHEWAHLRYGVYDEYVLSGPDRFYLESATENIVASRCSASLTGAYVSKSTGLGCSNAASANNLFDDDDCEFIDEVGLEDDYGSLMYKQFLTHVVSFCDNDVSDPFTLHNVEAPTPQNIKCNYQSVWEVMRSHGDFENGANLPRDIAEPVPTFRLVRVKDGDVQIRRIVLVLDTSGSMSSDNRMLKLSQGCANYINTIVEDSDKLGMVDFDNDAVTVVGLTEVDDVSRQILISLIPTTADGATSIGAGVLEGLAVLEADGGAQGGTLIVVSDGKETRAPYLADVWEEVTTAGATIHTVAVTDNADYHMDELAIATGGLSFLDASISSNAINEAFSIIGGLGQEESETSYTLLSESMTVSSDIAGTLSIDSSLGAETLFNLDYQESASVITLTVTSPSGVFYDNNSPECTVLTSQLIINCEIPGIAEVGSWSYVVSSDSEQLVSVTVSSKASTPAEPPIVAQAFWGLRELSFDPTTDPQKLFAAVHKGTSAVLNANVTALVEDASGAITVKTLVDNGAGADLKQNDGVYSAYFLEYSNNGRYNVKVLVESTAVTEVSPYYIVGVGSAPSSSAPDLQQLTSTPVSDLSRSTSGGSFQLYNYTATAVYPPARVDDLTVLSVDMENRTVTLTWTAVGAQLDSGTASSYTIQQGFSYAGVYGSSNYTELTQSDLLEGDVNSPLAAGQTESMVIQLPPDQGSSFYFGIIVNNDANGTSSGMSNIVGAILLTVDLSAGQFDWFSSGLAYSLIFAAVVLLLVLFILVNRAIHSCRRPPHKSASARERSQRAETKPLPRHHRDYVERAPSKVPPSNQSSSQRADTKPLPRHHQHYVERTPSKVRPSNQSSSQVDLLYSGYPVLGAQARHNHSMMPGRLVASASKLTIDSSRYQDKHTIYSSYDRFPASRDNYAYSHYP